MKIRRGAEDARPVLVDVVPPASREIAGQVSWRAIEALLRARKVMLDTGDERTATAVVAPRDAVANRESRAG